jgi:hypothetical protein
MNNIRDGDPAPAMELNNDNKAPRRFISSEVREAVVALLKTMVQHGSLPNGCLTKVGETFGIHRRSVARIWRDGQNGTEVWVDGRVGNTRPRMYPAQEMQTQFRAVGIELRGSARDCATQLGMSHTTFWRYSRGKNKIFRPVTLALKPKLTQRHRDNRIAFVNSKIDDGGLSYEMQYNCIHVDEKWFYVERARKRTYLTIGEEAPIRDTRNKNFIDKVMFLAAVARPQRQQRYVQREDDDNSWVFSGKVGIYPMVKYRNAINNSHLRPAGTLLVDNLKINRKVYQDFILDKLLPDISRKCPADMKNQTLYIQQDNASPHRINMELFNERCLLLGLVDCRIIYQPSQSPDFNICDLCFFPSIQSLYGKIPGVKDSLTCIQAVTNAFNSYDPNLLNRSFLSLMMNYNMTLKHGGCNKYAIPHMGKERLERLGELPVTLRVWQAVDEVPDDIFGGLNDDDNFDVLSMVDELLEEEFDGAESDEISQNEVHTYE